MMPTENTAFSRKSARDNPERYCGWFWIHCCPKKFKKRIREATDVCLRELKESNKSRFDSYSVRNSVSIISHITFRDCRVHIFSDNLSRNSCIQEFRSVGAWNVTFCAQFACRLTSGQSSRTKEPLARPGAFKQSGHFLWSRIFGKAQELPICHKSVKCYGNLGPVYMEVGDPR